MCDQFTNSMVRFVLVVATTAWTCLGTSLRYMRQHAVYLPWRGSHLITTRSGSEPDMARSTSQLGTLRVARKRPPPESSGSEVTFTSDPGVSLLQAERHKTQRIISSQAIVAVNIICRFEAPNWQGMYAQRIPVPINLQATRAAVDDCRDDGEERRLYCGVGTRNHDRKTPRKAPATSATDSCTW